MLKVGDHVKIKNKNCGTLIGLAALNSDSDCPVNLNDCVISNIKVCTTHNEFTIIGKNSHTFIFLEQDLELIDNIVPLINNNNQINMTTLEKFKTAFLKEPQKSLRKLGIINGDDLPTDEGMRMFMGWLLQQTEYPLVKKFIDEVVKPMMEEEKNEKK